MKSDHSDHPGNHSLNQFDNVITTPRSVPLPTNFPMSTAVSAVASTTSSSVVKFLFNGGDPLRDQLADITLNLTPTILQVENVPYHHL